MNFLNKIQQSFVLNSFYCRLCLKSKAINPLLNCFSSYLLYLPSNKSKKTLCRVNISHSFWSIHGPHILIRLMENHYKVVCSYYCL